MSSVFGPLLATRYLAAVGLVVLIYDHLLLFDHEVRHIWKAQSSWFKWLFLLNRYSTPLFLFINAFSLGPVSLTGGVSLKFCKTWIAIYAIFPLISLGIVNIFVARRIYVLWDSNKVVLKVLYFGIGTTYIGAFIVSAIGVKQSYPSIIYSSEYEMCIAQKISTLFAVGYGLPLVLELSNFGLLCWNALDRPRHRHTVLIKQLYIDGFVYFLAITGLRVLNIVVLSKTLPRQYSLLFAFFISAVIPAIVHRMILTLSDNDTSHDNRTEYMRLYVKKSEWSPSGDLRSISSCSNTSSFEIMQETYEFADSIL